MKLFEVEFEGMWPVGNALILIAKDMKEARKIANETVKHTKVKTVKEIKLDKSRVVLYLSGDY